LAHLKKRSEKSSPHVLKRTLKVAEAKKKVLNKGDGSHAEDFVIFEKGLNEIEKATFRQYIEHLHLEESRKSFFAKLKKEKDVTGFLKDFLDDTELEQLELETFKDAKSDSKSSAHSDLYDARDKEEWEKRILLWRATFSKAKTAENRKYLYGACLGNDLEELRKLKARDVAAFRVKLYESFVEFLNDMNQKEFEKFVNRAFNKNVGLKELLYCDFKTSSGPKDRPVKSKSKSKSK